MARTRFEQLILSGVLLATLALSVVLVLSVQHLRQAMVEWQSQRQTEKLNDVIQAVAEEERQLWRKMKEEQRQTEDIRREKGWVEVRLRQIEEEQRQQQDRKRVNELLTAPTGVEGPVPSTPVRR